MTVTHNGIRSVGDLVAQAATRNPGAIAVTDTRGATSYGDLIGARDRIVADLRALDIVPGEVVAVRPHPGSELIAALLAVWHGGAVTLPLDPTQPAARQEQLIADSGARLVIDGDPGETASVSLRPTPGRACAAGAAYIIYTSGSTGNPKGVICSQDALTAVATAQHRAFGITPADRVAQIAPWSVDAALSELTAALTVGAALHITHPDDRYPGPPLQEHLERSGATVLIATPSSLRALDTTGLGHVRLVLSAGEALTYDVAQQWAPGRRLLNGYGVTEGTIWSTYAEIQPSQLVPGSPLPIGTAIDGTVLHVLDEAGHPVSPGETGELYLGGRAVAIGYLDAGLTAERFLDTGDGRVFRTGDHVRLAADGMLSFSGREDDQVKLGGHRVELGEVRAVLLRHPSIGDCVVRRDGDRLVGYYTPTESHPFDRHEVTNWLEELLPLHMVPTMYIQLAALPLTAWGKVDVAALPDPAQVLESLPERQPRPASVTEEALMSMLRVLLESADIFPSDDIFMLGMTSLKVARLMSQIKDRFGVSIVPVDIFEAPTVAELAELVSDLAAVPAL
ncbi:non-ribosomal peptide synthetase [Mycobacterium sp. NPDC050853]|uniref:non-ribosomal peptide synthetase n=1 Tax=Mycobacterium sp. NPDC050853 TaxID=3155160 RepID=UPI0033E80D98